MFSLLAWRMRVCMRTWACLCPTCLHARARGACRHIGAGDSAGRLHFFSVRYARTLKDGLARVQ